MRQLVFLVILLFGNDIKMVCIYYSAETTVTGSVTSHGYGPE